MFILYLPPNQVVETTAGGFLGCWMAGLTYQSKPCVLSSVTTSFLAHVVAVEECILLCLFVHLFVFNSSKIKIKLPFLIYFHLQWRRTRNTHI